MPSETPSTTKSRATEDDSGIEVERLIAVSYVLFDVPPEVARAAAEEAKLGKTSDQKTLAKAIKEFEDRPAKRSE